MWQELGVAAVVLVAMGYAFWYLMLGALRRRLAANRPELGKSPSCSSACSSCGGCAPKSAADAGAGKPVQIVQIVRQR